MPRFRQKPSSRRQARPTASWLVLGLSEARLVVHGQRTTHLTLVKPSHHRRRFHETQRLSVKAFVGGPTECHVVVSDAQRIQLGQVDYSLVRELGHIRLDSFQEAWVAEHEPAFEGDALERFQARHAHREVWVIRFAVDRTATPRMVAQTGHGRVNYRKLPDGRWQCMESAEDAEADRGYTRSLSLSMDHEAPDALTDEEWKRHIHDNRDLTHDQWVALGRLDNIAERARLRAERGRNMRKKAA